MARQVRRGLGKGTVSHITKVTGRNEPEWLTLGTVVWDGCGTGYR